VRTKRILAPVLLIMLFTALLVQLPLTIAGQSSVYGWFAPIQDVRHILVENFVKPPDENAMQRAMIHAMIDTLDDPHTQYIPPSETANFNKELRGMYAGIGAEVNIMDGYLTIVTPMADSPALRAGILSGDIVLAIDGVSTFDLPLTQCIELLTGEVGSEVILSVRHLDGSEQDVSIIRANIVTRTVRGHRRVGEGWGYCVDEELGIQYVRVTQFNAFTVDELRAVLAGLLDDGLHGLILDLRDNPGGELPTAVAVADLFLETGTIVSVRPRRGRELVSTAQTDGTLPQFPMIVLLNGRSASASEIVAGALQDNGRAKILGTRSFGKGSVQEVRTLPYEQGTLKFTTAYYYLPSGRNLNRLSDSESWGVDPDPGLVLPVTDEDYFQMMLARREYEIIREPEQPVEPCIGADWIREHMRDEQFAAAVEAIRQRMQNGEWPVLGDDQGAAVAFDQELHRAAIQRNRLLAQLTRLDERIDQLRGMAADTSRRPLLRPEIDLIQGTLTVRDKNGAIIGTYRIEGGDVDLALNALLLSPMDDEP